MSCGSRMWLLNAEKFQSTIILCSGRKRRCKLPLLSSAAMHCHCSCPRLPEQLHCLHHSMD